MIRRVLLVALIVVGCAKSSNTGAADEDYIRTSVDLIRTRSTFPVGTDSATMERGIQGVYQRHHTTASGYKTATSALANDPEHAQKVFEAIRDSLKAKH